MFFLIKVFGAREFQGSQVTSRLNTEERGQNYSCRNCCPWGTGIDSMADSLSAQTTVNSDKGKFKSRHQKTP
jgi:hypothetical protein